MSATNELLLAAEATAARMEEPLYEIVDGSKIELLPKSILAAAIAAMIQEVLGPFARTHSLGRVLTEALFILDPVADVRRRPDVAFVSRSRYPLTRGLPPVGDWNVVPDLAVEVISPTDRHQDVQLKVEEYFRYGVGRVWLVLPAVRQLHVYEGPAVVQIWTQADVVDCAPLLPGLLLPLGPLFALADDAPASE
jgi:Uma2 family endonuclease